LVNIGGLSLLSSYFKIVRKNYPNLLWLDAGDQYTGTLESSLFKGETITRAFNIMGLDSTVTGNHEFDLGLSTYQERLAQSRYKTVVSNTNPQLN
jgi:2',3'-cyclic-nucleotide 2'-phosphodiesterase (5'-nucleotidase family)